ncbi:uncharacterized protein LOC142550888 [Primulina tabacum]|uniref:uncharacterized protein LOC142550888 n=1 Tax=Primulina tabacum TaxID=48773 RepID=UPI003F596B14
MACTTAMKQCRPWMRRAPLFQAAANRNLATSATAAGRASGNNSGFWRIAKSGDFAPVWMVAGMVCVAGCIGIHTATQQLTRSPSVQVTKKMRESVPEVEIPDAVLGSAEKFIDRSFLRKVAHIQDNYKDQQDSPTQSIFTRSRDIESLKSVGVRP